MRRIMRAALITIEIKRHLNHQHNVHPYHTFVSPFKDEGQTALFKDPVRTAL